MSKSALQTLRSYQTSLGNGTDEWIGLINDEITFKGPVDAVSGKDNFITLNKAFMPMVRGYDELSAFESGNLVCLEGTFKVESPTGNELVLPMAEIYEIKNEKIQSIRIYYDAEEFRKEFT